VPETAPRFVDHLAKFVHRNLLWLLLACYTLSAFFPQAGVAIRNWQQLDPFWDEVSLSLPLALLALMLFCAALCTKVSSVVEVARRPWALVWGLLFVWLGPVLWRPYSSVLCPPEDEPGFPRWRDYRDFAGGGMTDFGAHHYDIAQWGLGMDETGPVEVHPPGLDGHNQITYFYENGIRMLHGGGIGGSAVQWIGEDGWVAVNRGQFLETGGRLAIGRT